MGLFSRGDTEKDRLGKFVGGQEFDDVEDDDDETSSAKIEPTQLTQALDEAITERGFGSALADQLAKADLKWTVVEFWAVNIICVIVAVSIMAFWTLLRGGNIFVWMGVGFLIGFSGPKLWLKMRVGGRITAFNDQLGDAITLMANGLRAGYSLLQAMESVGKEMPDPISTEFRRVVQEISLGVDQERTFNNLLRRVPSGDLDLMIAAIAVQNEVGGNLAEILEVIGEVIRERVRIKGQISVLTAQAQMSGIVITALPVVLGLLLFAMNEEYMGRLVYACDEGEQMLTVDCSQPIGWIFLGLAIFGIVFGYIVMSKLTEIDV
ncbi:type II secretion system F family protein [Anaerolineales bacterium HSG6]|nr:type II secretion system F family protein [Anaerolineales bacterium HSG6]MDM8530368.1 type II secretion system F family protein [Anaerolineales bacterium HSG25]